MCFPTANYFYIFIDQYHVKWKVSPSASQEWTTYDGLNPAACISRLYVIEEEGESSHPPGIFGRDRVATPPCAMHLNCLINAQPTATCDLRNSGALCLYLSFWATPSFFCDFFFHACFFVYMTNGYWIFKNINLLWNESQKFISWTTELKKIFQFGDCRHH